MLSLVVVIILLGSFVHLSACWLIGLILSDCSIFGYLVDFLLVCMCVHKYICECKFMYEYVYVHTHIYVYLHFVLYFCVCGYLLVVSSACLFVCLLLFD